MSDTEEIIEKITVKRNEAPRKKKKKSNVIKRRFNENVDWKKKFYLLLSTHEKVKIEYRKERIRLKKSEESLKREVSKLEKRVNYYKSKYLKEQKKHVVRVQPKKKSKSKVVPLPTINANNQSNNNSNRSSEDLQLAMLLQHYEGQSQMNQMLSQRMYPFFRRPPPRQFFGRGRSFRNHGRSMSMNGVPENATYEQLLELDKNNVVVGLDKVLLTSYPVKKVVEKDGELKCSICLEMCKVGENVKTIPCFHKFHEKCCDTWLERSKTCPICKVNLEELGK